MNSKIIKYFLCLATLCLAFSAQAQTPQHGISIFGDLKYPAGFTHFDYVNPQAPKGGVLRLGATGSFDNFNAGTDQGQIVSGTALMMASLMSPSLDEPASHYAELCESITVSADKRLVTLTLKDYARWSDGTPISADDIIFSFNHLTSKKGPVLFQQYYHDVISVKKLSPLSVSFTLRHGENSELPMIITQMPLFPAHFWQDKDLSKTSLIVPPASGAYQIEDFEAGRFILYKRIENFWGENDPTFKGLYNFDKIRYDYYRDENVLIEAVKSGALDLREERIAKVWNTSYQIPALEQGQLKQVIFPHDRPVGMQAFIFNVRKKKFQKRDVRKALSYAFDFEWSNKALFYGQYKRTRSFFQNSSMAAENLPSAGELKFLEPLRAQIPQEVFTESYMPPTNNGTTQSFRKNLRIASKLLNQAGYPIKDGKRQHHETGEALDFTLLLFDPSFERIALPMAQNFAKLGVEMSVKTIDISQYITHLQKFDYDMITLPLGQTATPGNEQRHYWGTHAASQEGSRNYSGISNPAIDTLIEQIITQPNRAQLQDAVRALDRILQFHHIVIPQFHSQGDRVVFWDRFGMPDIIPEQGYSHLMWWFDPQKPLNQTDAKP